MYGSTRSKPHEYMDVIGYLRGPAALTHRIRSWVDPRDSLILGRTEKSFAPAEKRTTSVT